jgi:hypothetical protein
VAVVLRVHIQYHQETQVVMELQIVVVVVVRLCEEVIIFQIIKRVVMAAQA